MHAIEDAFGVTVGGQLLALRRLICRGEWVESHALHIFMLHAPGFLGYEDAIRMPKDHPEIVERGLRLTKSGNEIIALIGGRRYIRSTAGSKAFTKFPYRRDFTSGL